MEGVIIVIYFVVVILLIAFQIMVKKKPKLGDKSTKVSHVNYKSKNDERNWKKYGDVMHVNHYHNETKHKHYSADPCAYSEHFSWRKGSKNIYDDPWDFK